MSLRHTAAPAAVCASSCRQEDVRAAIARHHGRSEPLVQDALHRIRRKRWVPQALQAVSLVGGDVAELDGDLPALSRGIVRDAHHVSAQADADVPIYRKVAHYYTMRF